MTRRIPITGYRLKAGKLVPCLKHLPVNIMSPLRRKADYQMGGPLLERVALLGQALAVKTWALLRFPW